MIVDIEFTGHEIELIMMWSEQTLAGGHWGDGNAIFPDEARVVQKLGDLKKGAPHPMTLRDVEIILGWMQAHCGDGLTDGLSLSSEEDKLYRKLKAAAGAAG